MLSPRCMKSTSIFLLEFIGCFEVKPMGTKPLKKWDLLSDQGGALMVLSAAFLLGGILGCLFASLSDGAGAQELGRYLAGYLELAGEEGGLPRSLWPVLWGQFKYLLAVLILNVTALGAAGIPLIFGIRGFYLSFPAACFCRVFGGRGLFPAFLLFGLPALLWAPALFLAGVPGLLSALRQLRRSGGEGRSPFSLSRVNWYRGGACAALTLATGLLEYWVVPVLLQAAAHVVL